MLPSLVKTAWRLKYRKIQKEKLYQQASPHEQNFPFIKQPLHSDKYDKDEEHDVGIGVLFFLPLLFWWEKKVSPIFHFHYSVDMYTEQYSEQLGSARIHRREFRENSHYVLHFLGNFYALFVLIFFMLTFSLKLRRKSTDFIHYTLFWTMPNYQSHAFIWNRLKFMFCLKFNRRFICERLPDFFFWNW